MIFAECVNPIGKVWIAVHIQKCGFIIIPAYNKGHYKQRRNAWQRHREHDAEECSKMSRAVDKRRFRVFPRKRFHKGVHIEEIAAEKRNACNHIDGIVDEV